MAEDAQSILVPFLSALQASIAVLLTIFAGVVAAQFNLLSESSSKDISKVCVKLFMPALLIVNVGSQLHVETGLRYVAILIWGLIYSIISILFGIMMTRLFNMPAWVTPAITFNNTTSLPLLLVQALDATNLLDSIDSTGDAVSRAESYFLVNAMVCNSLTFALGPKLLNGFEEDAPESKAEDDENLTEAQEQEVESANESTSLLPNHLVRTSTRAGYAAYRKGLRWWEHLPQWTRKTLDIFYGFVNPPVIGAVLGATVGLVPALHRLFFNSQENGGYLNAWLTSALQNIGDLFAALQVVVVGVKLSKSLLRMKKGEPNGELSVGSFMLVNITRFLIWPAFSIPVIYLLATKTQLLGNDPILWFSMMLMPAGPSAMLLVALTDVHGAGEDEKMTVAKFLTITYAISPIIFLPVVGALKASEAAAGA